MTYLNETRRSGSFLNVFRNVADAFREALIYRSVYAQTMRELDALSPRELDDLGISASRVSEIAANAAREAVTKR
ncbi:MAG: DUF1127 domain-containing protein [Pseudomonadota bacterium]